MPLLTVTIFLSIFGCRYHKVPLQARATRIAQTQHISIHKGMVFTEIKPHYHQRHEEIIYIISGRGKMRIGAKESIAGPGSVFVIPPGMVHSYVNLGPRPSIGISIFCPPFDGKDRVFVSSGD